MPDNLQFIKPLREGKQRSDSLDFRRQRNRDCKARSDKIETDIAVGLASIGREAGSRTCTGRSNHRRSFRCCGACIIWNGIKHGRPKSVHWPDRIVMNGGTGMASQSLPRLLSWIYPRKRCLSLTVCMTSQVCMNSSVVTWKIEIARDSNLER